MSEGQVYMAWDMDAQEHLVWLFVRPCTDADVENHDTWGYKAKNEHGQYWHVVDLATGRPFITIDNVIDSFWSLV